MTGHRLQEMPYGAFLGLAAPSLPGQHDMLLTRFRYV